MKPEAAIQRCITDWLTAMRSKGVWWRRMNSGAVTATHNGKSRMVRYGSPGMADIFCTYQETGSGYDMAIPVWIEVKAPKGKQSDLQMEFESEVEASGHLYLVARSLDDVIDFFAGRL